MEAGSPLAVYAKYQARDVDKKKGPAIAVFYSPTCGHCHNFAADFDKAAKKLKGKGIKAYAQGPPLPDFVRYVPHLVFVDKSGKHHQIQSRDGNQVAEMAADMNKMLKGGFKCQ